MHILMVAAENGALAGGKVGGMGDVLRDLPRALVRLGHTVSVVTPAYGQFHRTNGARLLDTIEAEIGGTDEAVDLYLLPQRRDEDGLSTYVMEHPRFSICGSGRIYCNDPASQPFEQDSHKFALFSAAVATALAKHSYGNVDVVHLHDWHVGTIAALLRLHPRYRKLADVRIVFTIHNLALQGIRPFWGGFASLHSWFPQLRISSALTDPRYPDCYNPLRAALVLSDQVNTVSPTYAQEICDPDTGRGEGLAEDLVELRTGARLHGILNGCAYPDELPGVLPRAEFVALLRQTIRRWMGLETLVRSSHALALERVGEWAAAQAEAALTISAVGRLTDQKLGLLRQPMPDGRPALHHMLDLLRDDEEMLILGSGDEDLESTLVHAQLDYANFLFLRGYSDEVADQLYVRGHLFLMPSLFEPCGIAQMLAMRAGQPCLVNRTGGLSDTVIDDVDGFVFEGPSASDPAEAMLRRFRESLTTMRNHKRKYAAIRAAAKARRFDWQDSAEAYVSRLYS